MHKLMRVSVLLLAGFFPLFAGVTLQVNCGGAAPPVFPSITAALNVVHETKIVDATLLISGVCSERVQVAGFRNLILDGQGTAEIRNPGSAQDLVTVDRSTNVTLRRLKISGQGAGTPNLIHASASHGVQIEACVLEKGAYGIWFDQLSQGSVAGTAIQDLSNNGIHITEGSAVTVGKLADPSQLTTVARARDGITVSSSTVRIRGRVVLSANRRMGVYASHSLAQMDCGSGEQVIQGNEWGLYVVFGATLTANCPVVVEANRTRGVEVGSASVVILNLGAEVRNNGNASDPDSTGGMLITGTAQIYQSKVTNNSGYGAQATRGGVLTVWSSVVTGNKAEGLLVTRRGVLHVGDALNTVAGNGNAGLMCNTEGYGYGESQGIGKMKCPGFDRPSGPKGDKIENP